jgi:hypothetical protein
MASNQTMLLNGNAFPYNPNEVDWSYDLNKISFNTIGGRVTQILSIKSGTLTIEGDSGSRENLLNLFKIFKGIQDSQINNDQNIQNSVWLIIPSRNWSVKVWLRSMEVAFDYQSVTYPYRMQFEIDEDFGAIKQTTSNLLDNLSNAIGWNAGFAGLAGGKVSTNGKMQITINYNNLNHTFTVDTSLTDSYNTLSQLIDQQSGITNATSTTATQ